MASFMRWYSMTDVRFRCVCTAPFGRPDVPLVYRMTTGSSSAAACGTSGVSGCWRVSRGMSSSMLRTASRPATSPARLASTTTALGPVWPSVYAASRRDDHALQPTVIAPTATAAQNDTIQPGWFAARMAIRSPGTTPYSSRSTLASDATARACPLKLSRSPEVTM